MRVMTANIFVVMSVEMHIVNTRMDMMRHKLTKQEFNDFCAIVDSVVWQTDTDEELKKAITWLDKHATKNHKTIYELLLRIYTDTDVRRFISKWRNQMVLNKKGGSKS